MVIELGERGGGGGGRGRQAGTRKASQGDGRNLGWRAEWLTTSGSPEGEAAGKLKNWGGYTA